MDRRGFIKLTGLGGLGLFGIMTTSSCSKDSSGTSPSKGPIRIGAFYPMSGSFALMGEESWRGANLAMKRRNETGGIRGRKVEYVRADIPDVSAATSEARRLMTNGQVRIGIGTYSSALSLAASEVFARSGGSYFELNAVTNQITNRGYESVYKFVVDSEQFLDTTFDFLAGWGAKAVGKPLPDLKIRVVHEDSAAGSSIGRFATTVANSRGVKNIAALPYSAQLTDLTSIILRLRADPPDVVIASSYAQDGVLFARQVKENGLKIPLFAGIGGAHGQRSFGKVLGPVADGVFSVANAQALSNPKFAPGLDDFLKLYKAEYNDVPFAAESVDHYVGASALFDIIDAANGNDDPKEIRKAALQLDIPAGGTAAGWGIKFDERGHNTRAFATIGQWDNGELKAVWPREAALVDPKFIIPFTG